jgi:hypothetical protein
MEPNESGEHVDALDWDDPEVDEEWCEDQRSVVIEYLSREKIQHGRVGDWPAWHAAPCVAIWAVESATEPDWIGWWVISGDLPTDYVAASEREEPQHPRKAIRAIAERWRKVAKAWSEGREHEIIEIHGSHEELGPLLSARAERLISFANDESLWEE